MGGKEGVQFWWPRTRSTVLRDETLWQGRGIGQRMGVGAELMRKDLEISIIISGIYLIMEQYQKYPY